MKHSSPPPKVVHSLSFRYSFKQWK